MDLRKLKKLIDLVEESGIAELEVTEGEEKVRITRVSANAQHCLRPADDADADATASGRTGRCRPAAAAEAPAAANNANALKSPMVGTFYRSASPGPSPSWK
jgi:acetyl-CoA carboxylase biotin carboxyl carrier protein